MKEQLLKWGFTYKAGNVTYQIDNDNVMIVVRANDSGIRGVVMYVAGIAVRVPNCTTKLALFTFLYNLGLIEI